MRYIVKSVVCDCGVFEQTDNGEQLKVICNSLSNAELIADILNTDLKNTKYEVIKNSKIDKAIEEIEGLGKEMDKVQFTKHLVPLEDVLKIIKRNIGE